MTSNTMEEDPGWFSPHLMQGVRDYQIYNLYGEAKFQGAVSGPIFPSNSMEVLCASVGTDTGVGTGIYGTPSSPTSTTLNGTTSAGATTFTVASPTGFATGQEVIIDTGYNAEARKISNVAGSVITVADALYFPHTSGVTVVSATTTTSSGSVSIGATSITVTSAAGIATNDLIQIDVNSISGTTSSEVRKVTNIVSTTLTLDVGLTYAHGSGVQIIKVNTPFTHTLTEANSLASLTVEKNLGSFQSLQFAGCRVGKFDLKAPTGNNPVEMSIDLSGQSVATMNTPTAITVTDELPFVFAEANLNMFGTLRTEVSNTSVTIDNGLKETYTYSNFHGPSFITPVTLHTSGSIDLVWSSLTDSTYGDFNRMANGTLGAYHFGLVHPTNGGTISVFQPQIVLNKYGNDVKMEDVIMSTLSYEATRPLSGPTQFTIQVAVTNTVYLPY